jgi:arylsulfatase
MSRSGPNFLLFITDQQRADHLGCAGEPVLGTPHIDALARQGLRFEQCHTATPICQPNRASLMTGRLPSAHGVQMNGRELSQAETTFVQVLAQAGWRTALVGKAHLQNITAVAPPWPTGAGRNRRRSLSNRFLSSSRTNSPTITVVMPVLVMVSTEPMRRRPTTC